MSNYQFFASEKKLEEYRNPKIKIWQGETDENRLYSTADESVAIRIWKEEYKEIVSLYTKKTYCNHIEWMYSEKNASVIIQYVIEHLKNSSKIQLWNIWLGDRSQPITERVHVSKFTTEHVKRIWGKEEFEQAECLEVYRY